MGFVACSLQWLDHVPVFGPQSQQREIEGLRINNRLLEEQLEVQLAGLGWLPRVVVLGTSCLAVCWVKPQLGNRQCMRR